jgi:beta-glucosidase
MEDDKVGWIGTFHNTDANGNAVEDIVESVFMDETYAFIADSFPQGLTQNFRFHVRGYLSPREHDVKFEFGVTVSGRARLFVDGKLVVDNWTKQTMGTAFFNQGTVEEKGIIALEAGKKHELFLEFANDRADGSRGCMYHVSCIHLNTTNSHETLVANSSGFRLGGREVHDEDEAMKQATTLAEQADVAIVIVGLNSDWETESYDRTTLGLPLRTDELIQKVAKANAKTIVVTQSVRLRLKQDRNRH